MGHKQHVLAALQQESWPTAACLQVCCCTSAHTVCAVRAHCDSRVNCAQALSCNAAWVMGHKQHVLAALQQDSWPMAACSQVCCFTSEHTARALWFTWKLYTDLKLQCCMGHGSQAACPASLQQDSWPMAACLQVCCCTSAHTVCAVRAHCDSRVNCAQALSCNAAWVMGHKEHVLAALQQDSWPMAACSHCLLLHQYSHCARGAGTLW